MSIISDKMARDQAEFPEGSNFYPPSSPLPVPALTQHSTRAHSSLAPSKAATWTVCTASPKYLEENAYRIVERSSRYADEGTKAHEVCDALMKGEPIPAGANEEMIKHGKAYRDFCASLHAENKVVPNFVELAVPLFYRPQDKGHVDYLLFQHTLNRIDVVDFKYGAGVKVRADHNKQMSVYARSAIEEYDLDGWVRDDTLIRLHIFQPRCRDLLDDFDDLTVEEDSNNPAAPKGIESTWEITWDRFKLFTETEIGVPAQLIQDNATHLLKFVASESTCKWCPASAFCDTRVAALSAGSPVIRQMALPEKIEPTPPEQITDENLAQILRHAPDVKKWLTQCEEYAFNRAMAGNPLPQTKLIAGRGTRKWTDEEAAVVVLESANVEPYEKKLISPSAAEKLLKEAGIGKKDFHAQALDALTQRIAGGPKLTSIADPRPEWKPQVDALSEFSVVPEGEE